MRHLEHIERTARRQAIPQEMGVDVPLHVTGEQHPPLPVSDVEDHGDVVDAPALVRRMERYLTRTRPEDAHRDTVEAEGVTRRQQHPARGGSRQGLPECSIAGPSADHAWFGDHRHAVALQQQGQTSHVVLVGVRQQGKVQPPIPGRDTFIEQGQEPVGIRPAVDQHARASWTLDEHGVPLADVQDRDPQTAVSLPAGQGAGRQK